MKDAAITVRLPRAPGRAPWPAGSAVAVCPPWSSSAGPAASCQPRSAPGLRGTISLVADTHALIWHLTAPDRLGPGARRAFAAADAGRWLCHVPAVALLEVALLGERGRLRIGPAQVLDTIAGHRGYASLAVDVTQAIEFAALPGVRDPLDRLVVAAARATGPRLLGASAALDGHGVQRVWD